MTMDSPVSPANIPVPPVIIVSSVLVEVVAPVAVPVSVKVPNTVPPAKTSMNVPLDVNIVGLEKMRVPMFVEVKLPDSVSTPEPVKFESKTQRQGLAVTVKVEFPVIVPDVGIESA
jgi:hypothetical protein